MNKQELKILMEAYNNMLTNTPLEGKEKKEVSYMMDFGSEYVRLIFSLN